jgi:hypothetical protein
MEVEVMRIAEPMAQNTFVENASASPRVAVQKEVMSSPIMEGKKRKVEDGAGAVGARGGKENGKSEKKAKVDGEYCLSCCSLRRARLI